VQFQLKHAANEFAAISGIVGGISAQEIIKMTGKYTPIHQWMHADYIETMNECKDEDRIVHTPTR